MRALPTNAGWLKMHRQIEATCTAAEAPDIAAISEDRH